MRPTFGLPVIFGFFVLLGPTLLARVVDLATFGFAPFTFALVAVMPLLGVIETNP